jgi:hypothetical protein
MNLNKIREFWVGGLLCLKMYLLYWSQSPEKRKHGSGTFLPSYFSNLEAKTTGELCQILFQCSRPRTDR